MLFQVQNLHPCACPRRPSPRPPGGNGQAARRSRSAGEAGGGPPLCSAESGAPTDELDPGPVRSRAHLSGVPEGRVGGERCASANPHAGPQARTPPRQRNLRRRPFRGESRAAAVIAGRGGACSPGRRGPSPPLPAPPPALGCVRPAPARGQVKRSGRRLGARG